MHFPWEKHDVTKNKCGTLVLNMVEHEELTHNCWITKLVEVYNYANFIGLKKVYNSYTRIPTVWDDG